ncbi:MAG: DUF1795 domain-containing protein [Thermomicrobiales bacterium]|nr:DUF1795 domain-containing protein [Thermomicrobiales bacterium]
MINRRFLLLLTILTALPLILAACGGGNKQTFERPDGTAASGPVTLTPLSAGRDLSAPDGWYTIRIPTDWIESPPLIAELAARETTGANPLSLRITREALDSITTAQAYLEATRRDVNARYENVVTLSLGPVTINNVPATRWLYTATVDGEPRMIYQIFIVQQQSGLVLTGLSAPTADYQHVSQTFDAIAGTISFGRG